MPYSEFHADRIRNRLSPRHFTEKKMMGGIIFMVRDAMCIGLDFDKSCQEDRLMVRVGKLHYEELLNQRGSTKMDFTGQVMRGFLFIKAAGFDLDEELDYWIEHALAFNNLLTIEER